MIKFINIFIVLLLGCNVLANASEDIYKPSKEHKKDKKHIEVDIHLYSEIDFMQMNKYIALDEHTDEWLFYWMLKGPKTGFSFFNRSIRIRGGRSYLLSPLKYKKPFVFKFDAKIINVKKEHHLNELELVLIATRVERGAFRQDTFEVFKLNLIEGHGQTDSVYVGTDIEVLKP